MVSTRAFSALARMAKKQEAGNGQSPAISIVIIAEDQEDALRNNLPLFLQQKFIGTFEVIVVDMASKDDSRILLEALTEKHQNLHVTLMPDSTRDISKERLAITLGIRAASHEWIVLTKANCKPAGQEWLATLAQHCTQGYNAVFTPTLYNRDEKPSLRQKFSLYLHILIHYPWAKCVYPYSDEGNNLCYRRSFFLQHKGFSTHANLNVGATEIMVNQETSKKDVNVCLNQSGFMYCPVPSSTQKWHTNRVFFHETERQFKHKHRLHLYKLSGTTLIWAQTLYLFAICLYYAITNNFVYLGTCMFLWVIYTITRSIHWHRSLSVLGEKSMHLALPFALHFACIWDFEDWLRYKFTKKNTFRKKFI